MRKPVFLIYQFDHFVTYYASIMLNTFKDLLYSKLYWHNYIAWAYVTCTLVHKHLLSVRGAFLVCAVVTLHTIRWIYIIVAGEAICTAV